MKIIKPYHEIIDQIDGEAILRKIETCGRTCYKSEDRITEDSAKKFVAGIIRSGHHSVIEHVNLTVRFVCDRGISHEIVRHRLASYSQESTRFCRYTDDKMLPAAEKIWLASCRASEFYYELLIGQGIKPEIARNVLPTSLKTEVVMTCNLREWKYVFRMRCQKAAHPQIREIMLPLLKELHEKIPVVFDEEFEMFREKISCSQCTHWNDGYGNDDICGCLGCPQNCDNYVEIGGEPCKS